MAERRVPRIRFKGFEEDWEQRKLGDIAEKVCEKNCGMQYSLTLTNSAEFGVIAQRDFFDHDIAKASSLNGYYVVHNEDFVYNPRISVSAPVGPVNRNKLGETGVMSPLYTVFRPHDINATYLEYFFKSGFWHKFMNFNGDSGARADRFSIKDQVFFEMPIPFPDPIEQRNIGNYLKRLDSLLSLHQRKLEKLKILKKAMLEKMFPKNGARVPEIRFSGFTDDWEQRKFADLVIRESIIADSRRERPSVEYEDVIAEEGRLNKDLRNKKTKKQGIVFFDTDILYGKLRPYLHNWLMPTFDGVAVGDWWVLRPIEVDKSFLYRIIQTYKFDEMANQSSGSKMPRADWKLISETEFEIPSNLAEQRIVGNYFMLLDSLISLHQRKLEKLRQIKKSMLERMFV